MDLSYASQHKRLRERAWVLPTPTTKAALEQTARPALLNLLAPAIGLPVASTSQHTPSPFSPHSPAIPSSHPQQQHSAHSSIAAPLPQNGGEHAPAAVLSAIDVEFEQLWDKEWIQTGGQGITQQDIAAMQAENDRAQGLR